MSCYGDDVVKLILPMEFERERRSKTIVLPSTNGKVWEDPRTNEGELLWPSYLDAQTLAIRKRELGSYNYAGQYQQRPAPEEGGIIQRNWFRVWTKKLPTIKYMLQSWDTALTAKETSSYSACTTWGTFEDENKITHLILISAWRDRVVYPELLKRAIRLKRNCSDIHTEELKPNKQMQPDITLVEAKASGHPLISDLNSKGIIVHGFNPDKYGDKMQRVHLVTPFIECGRVWVISQDEGDMKRLRPDHEMLIENAILFPNAEARDLVDTMTQTILYLSKVKGVLTHVMNLNFTREDLPKEQMPGYVPPKQEKIGNI
jgi:phage terminase large subunit-like protein